MALSARLKRLLTTGLANKDAATELIAAVDASTAQATNATATNATYTNLTTTNATINSLATFANNANIATNTTTGTMFGTAANQKIGKWGANPVIQPSGTGELLGLNGNAATAANATNMNSNGNIGTKYYTFNDIVKALKLSGDIASS